MSSENKFLIGIGIITFVLIIGGVFFFSRGDNNQAPQQDKNFDQTQLTQDAKHAKGTVGAQITIVEFADLQCPACQAAQPIMNQALEKYHQNIYFVFRHYPLTNHKNSETAAKATEAAGAQGKFFEMVDLVYADQKEWEQDANPKGDFRKFATQLGLNLDQFNQDMEKNWDNIKSDFALGARANVQSTPTFFINGQMYPGVIQSQKLDSIIQTLLPKDKESTNTPQTSTQ